MHKEIETKFRLDDPTGILKRLAALGARRHSYVLLSNAIFDNAAGDLRQTGRNLRIRTARSLAGDDTAWSAITLKEPREPHETKIREELELRIEDGERMCEILKRLGYRQTIWYETRRQNWYWQRCEVAVDELPKLGWFVEIEGPTVEAVHAAGDALGLRPEALEQDSYVAMTAWHGETDPAGGKRLTFASPG